MRLHLFPHQTFMLQADAFLSTRLSLAVSVIAPLTSAVMTALDLLPQDLVLGNRALLSEENLPQTKKIVGSSDIGVETGT